ncbi:MAG: N-6 DNA methylase, partial [Desulfobacteraceae bacterium]
MADILDNITGNEKSLNETIRKKITSALEQVGYLENERMLLPDVRFVGEGGAFHKADMVAYSSPLRQDADTAVIGVKGTENSNDIKFESDVAPFRSLATPVIIFAEYKKHHGIDEPRVVTVGLSKDKTRFDQSLKHSKKIPISRFKEYLRDKQEYFTPRNLQKAKLSPEQLTIFDIKPDLIKQAVEITTKGLVKRFEHSVKNILDNDGRNKREIINGAIKLLGARILRDRLRENWPLTNGAKEFLSDAGNSLPGSGYFIVPTGITNKLDPLLDRLSSAFDFSQVSMDMVGKFYESAFVNKELRDQWGIHYTPSLLSKTLLSRMPIEELPPDNRILADPTCGSGSLLVAGYERLAEATYLSVPRETRHQHLVNSIFGNDKDKVAGDIAKMTLMLFHPPHKNNWKVTEEDAESDQFGKKWLSKIEVRPTIIVANPPFGGVGGKKNHTKKPRVRNQQDRSALILKNCLDILADGGLLGIILTETVLSQKLVKPLRDRLIKECQILEQWDVPIGWFDNVTRPAMAWVIRKIPPSSKMFFIHCLQIVRDPELQLKSQGIIKIDVADPPDILVPTMLDNILNKMEISQNRVDDHYVVMNGLRPMHDKIDNTKTNISHPWSGNAEKTTPFSDLSNGLRGWLELIDDNFEKRGKRTALRKILEKDEPMVMFRVNRTAPWKCKWSSVALIDIPEGSRKVVAPSESFDATFSKSKNKPDKKNDIYALWGMLNHPLASIWFHELQRGSKIPINNYRRKFPLPNNLSKENINSLASLTKDLIETKRNGRLQDTEKIKSLITTIDDLIYKMYGINDNERNQIDVWFGNEQRPLLKDIYKPHYILREENSSNRVDYTFPAWETTCETLEINFEDEQIKLAIDGLKDYPGRQKAEEDGVW